MGTGAPLAAQDSWGRPEGCMVTPLLGLKDTPGKLADMGCPDGMPVLTVVALGWAGGEYGGGGSLGRPQCPKAVPGYPELGGYTPDWR